MNHRLTIVTFPGDARSGIPTTAMAACDCGWHQQRADSVSDTFRAYSAHLTTYEPPTITELAKPPMREAFEAGWIARDKRSVPAQRFTEVTDIVYTEILNVPNMVTEDWDQFTWGKDPQ